MPARLTEITEIATGLGTLAPDLSTAVSVRPSQLVNVDERVWERLVAAYNAGEHLSSFAMAFANGAALLRADDGLRSRPPRLVEWKGAHRPPGDDVIPADLRIDHVYQVSCKYLSRILHNLGPARLFDRLLVGEERSGTDWFGEVAPVEYQGFYDTVRNQSGVGLPTRVTDLTPTHRGHLRDALRARILPEAAHEAWMELSAAVSRASAARWAANLRNGRMRLRMLWRLLRIGDTSYFVLGTDGKNSLRLRVASAWDWVQKYELRSLAVTQRFAGQPEVGWHAIVRDRPSGVTVHVHGHIEVRWSHGRFGGFPEAKVYLDVPHANVPGYSQLA